MCPACFATLALTTAGGAAAGGVSVLALRRLFHRRRGVAQAQIPSSERKS